MKLVSIMFSFLVFSLSVSAAESCRIIDQSSSISTQCSSQSPPGTYTPFRCYADVEYEKGVQIRVWGGCYPNMSDCFWSGVGAVDPCE